jgi:predicted DNA-binding protein YlxM (UPF0122 family)
MTGFNYAFAQELLDKSKRDPKNPIAKIGALCVETDTSVAQVASYFSVSRQSVYGWLTGEFQPDEDKLKKADKFIAKLETKKAKIAARKAG